MACFVCVTISCLVERCPHRDSATMAWLAVWRVSSGCHCPLRWRRRDSSWLCIQIRLYRQAQRRAYWNIAAVAWLAVCRVYACYGAWCCSI